MPVLLALLGETNPAALAVMTAAALAHEATAHRDVALASGSAREMTAGEQQTHSFVETLPFVVVGLLAARNWPRLRWSWRQPFRRGGCGAAMPPLPGGYLLAVTPILFTTGAIPYAEELARCLRHRGPAPARPESAGIAQS